MSDLVHILANPEGLEDNLQNGVIAPKEDPYPLSIVLTGGCDLAQDFKIRTEDLPELEARIANTNNASALLTEQKKLQRKLVPNVLFARVFLADDVRPELTDQWNGIRDNNHARYQYLCEALTNEDAMGEGLEPLVIDFQRLFMVPTNEVYVRLKMETTRRRTCLLSPFVEELTHRFASYLSRVVLEKTHWEMTGHDRTGIANKAINSDAVYTVSEVKAELGI